MSEPSVQPVSHPEMHAFDRATEVVRDAEGWCGATSDLYWAFVGPFGGATAATMLRAVLVQGEARGDPLAITVNFCAPIARGAFRLKVTSLRQNRSTQHWSVELTQGDGGALAFASVVLAERRDSWSWQSRPAPERPAFEEVAEFPGIARAAWANQYRFRFVTPMPDLTGAADKGPETDKPGPVETALWLADRSSRPVDALSLTAMSDAFFGRIFHALNRIVPFGTVSMTTYFHADSADLAADRSGRLYGTVDASIFHKSYGDQTGALWSPSGRLLATTQQIAYFKA